MEKEEKNLAKILWNARSTMDVDEIVKLAKNLYGASWRPVGDRRNNIGTINIGSEPGLAIVERVTNMFDAMLELGHSLNPGKKVTSPQEAAHVYFGVPNSGLCDMDNPRPIAENMVLSLDDSGTNNHPTIVVHDRGTGQTAADFPKTLVSLNEENKVGKPWTMGTYGQGGSGTLGFCKATIILSRRHPKLLNGADDQIAWTIVLKRYDSSKIVANYEFLVGNDNEVFSLDPMLFPNFEHGTRFVHVEYDLQIRGPFTTNPFQFFNAALFDPILPFILTGTRTKEKKYGSRVILGNTARLRNIERAKGPIEMAHTDAIKLDLGPKYGIAIAHYWILRRPESASTSSDPTASYVQANYAISMTLHGQRQDAEARYWIRKTTLLSFLYKRMIIQIDATGLTGEAKAELFASTRERGRIGDIRSEIYRNLASCLRLDPDLKELNYEEKERLLKKSTDAASDKVRQRLGRYIRHKLKELSKSGKGDMQRTSTASGVKKTPPTKPSGKRGKPRDTSDHHLPNDPDSMSFSSRQISVRQAERAQVFIEINAKNRYLPNNDRSLNVKFSGLDNTKIRIVAQSALMGGRARWIIEAEEDAPLGDYQLTADLTTPNRVLQDTLAINVKKMRKSVEKPGKGKEPETGPDVRWVNKEQWGEPEINMNAKIVGRVIEDEESTIILVNRHYSELDKTFKGRNLTADQIETRANRYQYPVACGLWLQGHFVDKILPEQAQPPSEEYLDAEMRRLADAVIVAIDPEVDIVAEEEDIG
jgi:hypothetical protein